MKNLLLVFSFIILNISAFAQSKVGTIDAEYILNQLPEMAEVNTGLQTYNQELQTNLEETVTNFETLVKDYRENSTTFSEEDKKTKEAKIIELENDIKGFRQKAQVMMQMKRNDLTQPLYDKITTAMLEVIEEEKFTQIFNANGSTMAYASEDYDITLRVLKKLGIEVKE